MAVTNPFKLALLVFGATVTLAGAFMLGAQVPQTANEAFEVASVKPSPPQPFNGRGGGGACGAPPQIEPTRFASFRTTAYLLISWCYQKDCFSAEVHELLSGGPGWIKSDHFDVHAVFPAGTPTYTRQQFRDGAAPKIELMIRNMLADRFKLAVHTESREMPVYALTVGKNGYKLQPFDEASCDASPPTFPPQPLQPSQKRYCSYGVGIASGANRGGWKAQITANGADLKRFAELLSLALDKPVIDRTGISGVFDFRLESSVDGTRLAQFVMPDGNQTTTASEPARSIFTAIEDQLGLRLESAKGRVEVIVIDHVGKPDAN